MPVAPDLAHAPAAKGRAVGFVEHSQPLHGWILCAIYNSVAVQLKGGRCCLSGARRDTSMCLLVYNFLHGFHVAAQAHVCNLNAGHTGVH